MSSKKYVRDPNALVDQSAAGGWMSTSGQIEGISPILRFNLWVRF